MLLPPAALSSIMASGKASLAQTLRKSPITVRRMDARFAQLGRAPGSNNLTQRLSTTSSLVSSTRQCSSTVTVIYNFSLLKGFLHTNKHLLVALLPTRFRFCFLSGLLSHLPSNICNHQILLTWICNVAACTWSHFTT